MSTPGYIEAVETYARFGQVIHIGRTEVGVSTHTQVTPALVVGQDDDHIGRIIMYCISSALAVAQGAGLEQQKEKQEAGEMADGAFHDDLFLGVVRN